MKFVRSVFEWLWITSVRGAQGLFSRMTFRRELFVGGFKNVSKPAPKTGATTGFVGCVRRLQINGKDYDMRKGPSVGDTLYGINVGQLRFPIQWWT